jgi:hypothetical protein
MKLKNFQKQIKENSKIASIVIVVLLTLIIVVLTTLSDDEGRLKVKLKELGANFYENHYYDFLDKDAERRADYLEKYSSVGFKINLDNLARITNKDEKVLSTFVNKKTKESCDPKQTKVIIYPVKPYEKSSYKMKVELVCGFEKK